MLLLKILKVNVIVFYLLCFSASYNYVMAQWGWISPEEGTEFLASRYSNTYHGWYVDFNYEMTNLNVNERYDFIVDNDQGSYPQSEHGDEGMLRAGGVGNRTVKATKMIYHPDTRQWTEGDYRLLHIVIKAPTTTITINSSQPSGSNAQYTVDNNSPVTSGTYVWDEHTYHTISVPSSLANGGYLFSGWSDGGSYSNSRNYFVAENSSNTTIYAIYTAQYATVTLTPPTPSNANACYWVDGGSGITQGSFQWQVGTTHHITTYYRIIGSGGSWYLQNWSDGITSYDRQYVVPAGGSTLNATFTWR